MALPFQGLTIALSGKFKQSHGMDSCVCCAVPFVYVSAEKLGKLIRDNGGVYVTKVTGDCTHLVVSGADFEAEKPKGETWHWCFFFFFFSCFVLGDGDGRFVAGVGKCEIFLLVD